MFDKEESLSTRASKDIFRCLSDISAELAEGLQQDLANKKAEWGNERHHLQANVTRLGQRAVQADILEAQVQCQEEQLKEIKVCDISSDQMCICLIHAKVAI